MWENIFKGSKGFFRGKTVAGTNSGSFAPGPGASGAPSGKIYAANPAVASASALRAAHIKGVTDKEALTDKLLQEAFTPEQRGVYEAHMEENLAAERENRLSFQLHSTITGTDAKGKPIYTPTAEREATYRRLIDEVLASTPGAVTKEGESPTVIVLGGRGGSGKSKFAFSGGDADFGAYPKGKYLVLDADMFKTLLAKEDGIGPIGHRAYQYHKESGDMFDMAVDQARANRLNVVLDMTLNTDHTDTLRDFKKGGYRTKGYYMFLPEQTAAERALDRYKSSGNSKETLGDMRGRLVPPSVVLANTRNEGNFDSMAKSNLFDSWEVYSNDVPKGTRPEFVVGNTNASAYLSKKEEVVLKDTAASIKAWITIKRKKKFKTVFMDQIKAGVGLEEAIKAAKAAADEAHPGDSPTKYELPEGWSKLGPSTPSTITPPAHEAPVFSKAAHQQLYQQKYQQYLSTGVGAEFAASHAKAYVENLYPTTYSTKPLVPHVPPQVTLPSDGGYNSSTNKDAPATSFRDDTKFKALIVAGQSPDVQATQDFSSAQSLYIDSLPAPVKEAFRNYTAGMFTAINKSVAKYGVQAYSTETLGDPGTASYARRMAGALNSPGATMPFDIKLRRGMNFIHLSNGLGLGIENMKFLTNQNVKDMVGRVYTENAFSSTTIDMNRKMNFTESSKFGKVTLNIRAPKGTKGLYVRTLSAHLSEHEVVLPPKTKYMITSARKTAMGELQLDVSIL